MNRLAQPGPNNGVTDLFAGGGEMGARMRALDWSRTPLGDPATWPQSLRTVIRILLTSRFAMWMAWGPELTFFCNDAYLPTTGIKREWVLGARSDRVWAEIWPDIGPRIEHVLSTNEATWDEALPLYLERSGFPEETYHTFSYSPLADDSGATVGMLCVVAEVTERVIGERQLDLLRDMGARLSAATNRREVMAALEACLATGPPDAPFALAYLLDADAGVWRRAANHGLASDGPAAPAVIALEDPDPSWPLSVTATSAEPVPIAAAEGAGLPSPAPRRAFMAPLTVAEGGAPIGFLISGLNPMRAFDADYRGFLELLTGQVAAAIARADDFESARARAEALAEIDRAKTTFFSNISHEFRTPLTLMLGPLESILEKPRDQISPDDRSLVEVSHRNAQRLLRLVNALLDFSRIEAGRVEAQFQPTDLRALTRELASTFRSACERAGLGLQIDCDDAPALAWVDRDMWEKMVLNLLSNAFKFTFEGGISIRLSTRGDRGVLEVSDTGVGIPAAELPRLFERFHRVHGAQGRSFEGSGIGLALVHDLARLHGGEVSATSEVGVGTTLTVQIPLNNEHRPIEASPTEALASAPSGRAQAFAEEVLRWLPDPHASADGPIPAPTDPAFHYVNPETLAGGARRNGHVLLADDNADLRDYVRRLLEVRGYSVETADDGETALAAARARRPDLLLTDVMMPRLDGFGLLAAIRADPVLEDLPVVMLSARAGEEAQVEGLDAGADDYLAKPFSARELLARVSANLDMARLRRKAADDVRASEAKVQIEREFLASVLAKAPIGISIVDGDGRITMLNERAVELLGHRHEARGVDDFTAYGGIDAQGRPLPVEHYPTVRAIRGERVDNERMTYIRGGPNGRERIVLEVDAVPIRDAAGRPVGAVTVFDDAGAREKAEEALRARVEQAVAESAQAREALHQLQKLETIGQLTGGVAHDFNNLLTPIVAALDILARKNAGDERADRIISGAQQSAERARVLVNRLLTFGRRQMLETQTVDLGELVTNMSDLIERSVSARIAVAWAIAPDPKVVMVDPNQLELAILNLCVNARDAMPEGGALTIAVRDATSQDAANLPPGRYACVLVSDTGAGMDAETLQRAIEPFYTTKDVGKGTGLGLSMVHGLAAQSGGAFHLTSALGQGTTASICLPVVDARLEPRRLERRAPGPAGRTLRILLVDDEELVRVATAEMLTSMGHDVSHAASGAAALQTIRAGDAFDLLIADYMMPGMTGVDLVREARTLRPDLAALVVTGYAGLDRSAGEGLAKLAKPFGEAELETAIAQVMSVS